MSDREKLLGLLVGLLLAVFAVFGVFRSVQSGLRARTANITNMNRKIQQEEEKKALGLKDAVLVQQFKLRSLDANPDKAHLDFSHWLEMQVEEVGLNRKLVRYNDVRKSTDDYKELTYTVSGEGNIRQVRDLLYRIQSADTLHRVERFSLRQANDELKQLKLELGIAALSMGDIEEPKTPVGTVVESKLGKTLEDYDVIVTRNIFAPANNAPKFKSLARQTVELGKQLKFPLSATDADGHSLSYRLLDSPDDSAKVEKRNLVWKPEKLGDYEFEVEVEDDGVPSKTDIATVRVQVVPERKREAKEEFDDATVTELTGVVKGPRDNGLRIWLKVQSKDEHLSLGEGEEFHVGKWQGRVRSISRKMAVLETEDGQVYELGLGGILANAKLLEAR